MAENQYAPLVLNKRLTDKTKVARTASAVNAAKRSGAAVQTEKKTVTNAGHANTDHARIAKLDRDNEVAAPPKVDVSVGAAIAKARVDKGIKTQKELAQLINEKPQVVNEYESGKAIPNQQILGKLERALGVKLRGKNIGDPLVFGKKK